MMLMMTCRTHGDVGTDETQPAAATGTDHAGGADTSSEPSPRDVHREVQTAIDALEDLAESL